MAHDATKSNDRVFSISDRACPTQPTGGPGGVNYRLLLANKKYGYINRMYHIFNEVIIEDTSILSLSFTETISNNSDRLKRYFMKLDEYYHFTEDDIYIFHDVVSAYIFTSNFPFRKTILVYHQQGTLYREWELFTGKKDASLKEAKDVLLTVTMMSVKYMAFPSKGSIESVIESEPAFEEIISKTEIRILYNGCDRLEQPEASVDKVKEIIQTLKASQIPNFVTSATLNGAKGVERIPEFLSAFKEIYGPFLWVVVGDGVMAGELEENIRKYGIEEHTLWLRDRIPHNDMLAIFQYTDFYILTHRYSIFDFSTIEAMGYGNIPILTPIGGNKEVIIDNSGIFLYSLSDTSDFDEFVANQNFDEAKKKNVHIADELFSEKAFLRGYADLINEIRCIN
jgi:glycosyltransferase involved in cell wall biosynthesis